MPYSQTIRKGGIIMLVLNPAASGRGHGIANRILGARAKLYSDDGHGMIFWKWA